MLPNLFFTKPQKPKAMLFACLFFLLFVTSVVFLIIGFFRPQTSLFWVKGERTKKRSAMFYSMLMVSSVRIFIAFLPAQEPIGALPAQGGNVVAEQSATAR